GHRSADPLPDAVTASRAESWPVGRSSSSHIRDTTVTGDPSSHPRMTGNDRVIRSFTEHGGFHGDRGRKQRRDPRRARRPALVSLGSHPGIEPRGLSGGPVVPTGSAPPGRPSSVPGREAGGASPAGAGRLLRRAELRLRDKKNSQARSPRALK